MAEKVCWQTRSLAVCFERFSFTFRHSFFPNFVRILHLSFVEALILSLSDFETEKRNRNTKSVNISLCTVSAVFSFHLSDVVTYSTKTLGKWHAFDGVRGRKVKWQNEKSNWFLFVLLLLFVRLPSLLLTPSHRLRSECLLVTFTCRQFSDATREHFYVVDECVWHVHARNSLKPQANPAKKMRE